MKKEKTVRVILIICLLMPILFVVSCTFYACYEFNHILDKNIKEYGDFLARKETYFDYNTYFVIYGLSEEGKQKEVIVVPQYIDGVEVLSIGRIFVFSPFGQWESDVLRRVYIPFDCKVSDVWEDDVKVFVNCDIVNWNDGEVKEYINSYRKDIIEEDNDNELIGNSRVFYANVSYMYNYGDSKNRGYYWIDDYEYGTKILYKPEDPEREGYTFGGWYKESECINKWDFDNDTLPEYDGNLEEYQNSLKNNDYYTDSYQETRLYAKWIKN